MQSYAFSHIHIPLPPDDDDFPFYSPQYVCRLHFVLLQTLFYEDYYRYWSSFLCRHLIKRSKKKSCEKEKECVWRCCYCCFVSDSNLDNNSFDFPSLIIDNLSFVLKSLKERKFIHRSFRFKFTVLFSFTMASMTLWYFRNNY